MCLAILGISIFSFYTIAIPFKRGFFCHDLTLLYPYIGSTISAIALHSGGIGLTAIIVSMIIWCSFKKDEDGGVRNWKYCAFEIYGAAVAYALGALVSNLITDVAKYSIGRLRPHFFDVCKRFNYDTYCPPNAAFNTYTLNQILARFHACKQEIQSNFGRL